MLIMPDNDLNRFAIKKLTKEIEQQLADWKAEEELKLRYRTVNKAWAYLLTTYYIDDDTLYNYMVRLERAYFNAD